MQRIKRLLLILGAALLLIGVSYVVIRSNATSAADKDIDAFFSDYREADTARFKNHLRYITQNQPDVDAIILRHSDAIKNFTNDTLTPELNLMLNETRVEVSWHLAIIFTKRDGHWHPTVFDDYTADKKA